MRLVLRKSAKHKKKITAIEKRYPVFGLNAENSTGKLKANQISEGVGGGASARIGKGRRDDAEMMSFLDEIDQKFNLEDVDEKDLAEVKEFLRQRVGLLHSAQLTSDGELTREVAMMLS